MKRAKTDKGISALQKAGKSDSGGAVPKKVREKLQADLMAGLQNVTGTRTGESAGRIVQQAANALTSPKPDQPFNGLVQATAILAELAPRNGLEALLATQLVATYEAGLKFLDRAVRQEHPEIVDANLGRATRLMRLYLDQIQSLQKLRGQGQQKIVIERVDVRQGGQAIVGAVSSNPKTGGGGQ